MTGVSEERGVPPEAPVSRPRWSAVVYLALVSVLVFGPLLSLPLESLFVRGPQGAGFALTGRWWLSLASGRALLALLRSLLTAFLAASLSTILAALASGAQLFSEPRAPLFRALKALSIAPLASSGIVLALGWMALYGDLFSRSWLSLVMIHAVSALPFTYRTVDTAVRSLGPNVMDASLSLGASPARTLVQAVFPACSRSLASAWAFAVVLSLGEVNAALMLDIQGFETLPLLIYRAAGAYRFPYACAAGTVLALCCALAFFVSDSLDKEAPGGA